MKIFIRVTAIVLVLKFTLPALYAREQPEKGFTSISYLGFLENKGQLLGSDGLLHPEVKFILEQRELQLFFLETGLACQFVKFTYPEGYQNLVRPPFDSEKLQKMQKRTLEAC